MDKGGIAHTSLPKGGGSVSGIGEKFQPDIFTGTGNFSIPVYTSPGRNGFSPQLTLQYSSSHGNGIFGMGWDLSLPRITRKTEKGLPTYGPEDIFVLSGSEDLVPYLQKEATSRGYVWKPVVFDSDDGNFTIRRFRPRTEGLFSRIEQWTENASSEIHWRATTRENITSIFGQSQSCHIADPDDPSKIWAWLLEETFDSRGNRILYEYAQEPQQLSIPSIFENNRTYSAARYIRRIYYGNTPSNLDPQLQVGPSRNGRHYHFEILFDYGDLSDDPAETYLPPSNQAEETTDQWTLREDPFSSYRAGFEVRTLRRCERVLMFHHFKELQDAPEKPEAATLVRSTDMTYETDAATRLLFLKEVKQTGYRWDSTHKTFKSCSTPAVSYSYSKFEPEQQRYQSLSTEGPTLPPHGLNHPDYALVDLFGKGIPDIVHTETGGFRYWQNLGNGHLDRPHPLHESPMGLALSQSGVGITDFGGDGLPDLMVSNGSLHGFFETSPQKGWQDFQRLPVSRPLPFGDPAARTLDLTGDGLPDLLATTDHHFMWFQNLGENGYSEARIINRDGNLDHFPDIYFQDTTGRVRLADMTGDGLTDIVLLHNGRIDYWPNLGYGRFGKRVTMKNCPVLESQFNPKRLFLADLDGSGCSDLMYVDFDRVHFWLNSSGNQWGPQRTISGTPCTFDTVSLSLSDFYGNGTASLLWSFDQTEREKDNYKILDFSGGKKPYLLNKMDNNMGATTRVHYSTSTRFFLEDAAKGEPWTTQLSFPVQVVEKTETFDHISKTKQVTTFKYHHGYFDGREREFRGFGRVDRYDTESFEDFKNSGLHEDSQTVTNADRAFHTPPVLTKAWFHPGLFYEPNAGALDEEKLLALFAEEYFKGDNAAFDRLRNQLPQTPSLHEAYRALRGSEIRREVYSLDESGNESIPYLVTENAYTVRELQPQEGNAHSVFLRSSKESLNYRYDRNPNDPRVTHQVTLGLDDFGNVTDSLSIAYPRRQVPAGLEEQSRLHLVYTHSDFINNTGDPEFHFVGVPCQNRRYEITGFNWTWGQNPATAADFNSILDDSLAPGTFKPFDWQRPAGHNGLEKRMIGWSRTYFRKKNAESFLDIDPTQNPTRSLNSRLSLGMIDSLALPYESYEAVFTDQMIASRYHDPASGTSLLPVSALAEGGYHREPDLADYWWIPSGQQAFDKDKFFQPVKVRDPFGNDTTTKFDSYGLMILQVEDSHGNATHLENNYRVLQPEKITDINGHHSLVLFDALNRVVATAVQSKNGEGDSLEGLDPEISDPVRLENLFNDPYGKQDPSHAATHLIKKATTRIVYDPNRFRNHGLPPTLLQVARETHSSNLGTAPPDIQIRFSYSDGFERIIQIKSQAKKGPTPRRDSSGSVLITNGQPEMTSADTEPRWLGTGWTVFNNKGNPVKKFEPFFSDTQNFEFDLRVGVSPFLFYDPLNRLVCTLYPDHSYEKIKFDPWKQTLWDANDTLAWDDPRLDPEVGIYFSNLDTSDFLPGWHTQRKDGALGPAEKRAALKAKVHGDTPSVQHLDTLGRPFLQFSDDGTSEKIRIHTRFDIQGNQLAITDPRGLTAFQHQFDLTGRKLKVDSIDSGKTWIWLDVTGNPLYSWDANGNQTYTRYDQLRRVNELWLKPKNQTGYSLAQKSIFGDTPGASPPAENHRGRLWKLYDGAGLQENRAYDFKGNIIERQRTLLQDGQSQAEWASTTDPHNHTFDENQASSLLDLSRNFVQKQSFDALNRMTQLESPDGAIQNFRFNPSGLLESLHLKPSGAGGEETLISSIDYNEKNQRTRIVYGNGVESTSTFDSKTSRLRTVNTRRKGNLSPKILQDLNYTYDPAGNIMELRDDAHKDIFYGNQTVNPQMQFTYDPLYRLITAEGREHESMGACHYQKPEKKHTEFFKLQPATNAQALTNYAERYEYDKSGNLTLIHHDNITRGTSWTRDQRFEVVDPTAPEAQWQPKSNRLWTSKAGCSGENSFQIDHDPNGNITGLPHLPQMKWNPFNQLVEVQANNGSSPNRAYYQYDAAGQRVRKTVLKNGGSRIEETLYLGEFEIYTSRSASGPQEHLETLHIADGNRRFAIVERILDPSSGNVTRRMVRYQLSNHLDSAILEVDDTANAAIISYEEYYPYGGSAYQAGRDEIETKRKRYRYSGKERDDETGLYYYGARYYAPWLGRWMSPDPAGTVDGLNLYQFTRGSPNQWLDRTGRNTDDEITQQVRSEIEQLNQRRAEGNKLARDNVIKDRDSKVNISEMEKRLERKRQIPQTETTRREIATLERNIQEINRRMDDRQRELESILKDINDDEAELKKKYPAEVARVEKEIMEEKQKKNPPKGDDPGKKGGGGGGSSSAPEADPKKEKGSKLKDIWDRITGNGDPAPDKKAERKWLNAVGEAFEKGKPVLAFVGDKTMKAIPIGGAVYTFYSTEGSTGWKLLNVVGGEIGVGPLDLQTVGEGTGYLMHLAVEELEDPERAKAITEELERTGQIEKVRNPWAALASSEKL